MEEDLRSKLLANASIAGMAKAIAWGARPDGSALPSITLMLIAPGRAYTHDGADDLAQPLVQFDFWAASQWETWRLQRLVQAEMESAGVSGGTHFGPCFLEGEQDMDPEDTDGGVTVYRRLSEWRVYATPTN